MTPKDAFLDSLSRCEAAAGFTERFYRRFLASSEDVTRMFRHTDFSRQHRMLRRSLELSALATVGDAEGLQELQSRVETHSRMPITAEMYDFWLASAMATARECDPEWSAEVEAAWQTILGFVVRRMGRAMPSRPPVERRRAPRLMLALGGSWRATAAEATPCLVGGLSVGGCFIYGYASHPPGTPVEVTLTVTGRAPLVVKGRAAHSDHTNGFGVAFDELSAETQAGLDGMIALLKTRGATVE